MKLQIWLVTGINQIRFRIKTSLINNHNFIYLLLFYRNYRIKIPILYVFQSHPVDGTGYEMKQSKKKSRGEEYFILDIIEILSTSWTL